jgi:CRISPR-associated exonuclease Cas4
LVDAYISAGDVGRYEYCPLNWKLSRQGKKGSGGEVGIREHGRISDEVDALEYYQSQARWSIQTSFLLALVAISGAALALELLFLEAGGPLRFGLVLLSVMWVCGSLYLFVFDLYFRGRGDELTRKARIVSGDVAYSDSGGNVPMMRSKIVPLQGRPDYIVLQKGSLIPVEVKTGKTPPRPYVSHVMQLAAYCYLVAENRNQRPPFGVLSYPDKQFEVPYTPELEDQMLKTLLRIQLASRTGEAHRNHENPKRCLGCSRRDACPERLA